MDIDLGYSLKSSYNQTHQQVIILIRVNDDTINATFGRDYGLSIPFCHIKIILHCFNWL